VTGDGDLEDSQAEGADAAIPLESTKTSADDVEQANLQI
jgi:hypothetical protein